MKLKYELPLSFTLLPDKVDRLENEIQSANEVKVATPHTNTHTHAGPRSRTLGRLKAVSAAVRVCVFPPGIRGEADPFAQGDPSEANQQSEGRAGRQGERNHRAAGVKKKIKKNNPTHSASGTARSTDCGVDGFVAQREPEDRAGAGEAEGGAREAQGGGPGEEPPAARAHVMRPS